MIELILEKEMIDLLGSLKGKILQSYEHYPCPTENENPGFMRLNFSRFAIDLETDYKVYTCKGFSGQPFSDEATCLIAKKANLKEKYSVPEGWAMRRYLIGEVVSEVMVVRDSITSSNGDEYSIDNAIIIKTAENTYTISKGCEVDPSIYIRIGNKIDVPYSVNAERRNFSDREHCLSAKVVRDFIFL